MKQNKFAGAIVGSMPRYRLTLESGIGVVIGYTNARIEDALAKAKQALVTGHAMDPMRGPDGTLRNGSEWLDPDLEALVLKFYKGAEWHCTTSRFSSLGSFSIPTAFFATVNGEPIAIFAPMSTDAEKSHQLN